MTARQWFGNLGLRRGAKQCQGTKRRHDARRAFGIRTISLEQLESRMLLSGGRVLPSGNPGDNIALGRSYAWNTAPNYAGGCQDSNDSVQLTDGQYTGGGTYWEQTPTVGWVTTNPVDITIDLGVVQPIRGASFSTAGGISDVYWPTAINVLVSNDNVHWFSAKDLANRAIDLVAMDENQAPPPYGTFATHTYLVSGQIATFGRYVKFDVVTNTYPNYVFTDEIRVFRGDNSLLGPNMALNCSYTMSPAPNYVGGSTDSGDVTQLTDGQYTSGGTFWEQPPTVGWTQTSSAQITIDLGKDRPIDGISYNTAAGGGGVTWPTTIDVLVSTDGANFYSVGDLVDLSALDHGQPPSSGVWSYWTDRFVTHGRYVRIVAEGYPYIFADEIEVYQGRDEMRGRLLPSGNPGDNVALGRSYTWNTAPNYVGGCQDSNDTVQLTDGQYTDGGTYWEQTPTVGWVTTNPVNVTIDLGIVQPIQGVSINMAGGISDVYWPTAINVSFSNDNINWYDAVNLVAMDPNPPQYGTFLIHNYVQANTLATYGRYVKFNVVTGAYPNYVFMDEIQIYRGADSLLGQNVALGRSYIWDPVPNSTDCSDADDIVQLTDGQYTASGTFWTQPSTVGWAYAEYVLVVIDLGQDRPIGGFSFNTAAGSGDVTWPYAIDVLVSTNGTNYYNAGEIVSLSADHGLPQPSDTRWTYWTDRLATHGRYVAIIVAACPWVVVDEIEVYQGRDAMLSQPYQGSPITDFGAFVADTSQRAQEIRRIVLDAQNVRQNVIADANLTSQQKAQYTAQLNSYIIQAMYDNPPDNLVLPIDTLHGDVFKIQAALWRANGLTNLTAWTTPSAWDYITPTQLPSVNSPTVGVTLMKNEFRSCAVNISNPTSSDINVGTPTITWNTTPASTNVTIRAVKWIDTNTGIADLSALPAIPGGGIVIPAGMTCQIWLTFNPTGGTTAGTYTGTLNVTGLGAGIPVTLKVSSLALPAATALGWSCFDELDIVPHYDVTQNNRSLVINELKTHFVDTTWATAAVMPKTPNPTDFSAFDAWVALWPDARNYRVYLNAGTTFSGYTMGTSQFNTAVGSWINAYAAHWSQLGISLNRIALEILDEPRDSTAADIINNWAAAIHAAQPNVLIWEDPTFADPTSATAQNMFANCDILCVRTDMFTTGSDSFRNAFKDQRDNHGKKLEFYSCSGPTYALDPYNHYRLQAWTNFRENATIMNFWAAGDQGTCASWDTAYPLRVKFTPLFLSSNSVTNGKAMDAIREGVEDYEYLSLLKSKIAAMIAGNCPSGAIYAAQSVLDGALDSVLGATGATDYGWLKAKDRTVADTMRLQVLNILESLSSFPSLAILSQPTNQAVDVGQKATFIVDAAGSGPVTYQWQLLNGSWQNISGATGAYYTTANAVQADNGKQYRVVVTNSYGSVTSATATMFVNYGSQVWWKLDESGTTTTAADSDGTPTWNGTLVNFPTTKWATGILNNAAVFDGTDSYISTATSTTGLKYTGAELTLSTWVYVNSTETNGAYLISKPWNGVNDAYNYQVGFNSGNSSTTGTVFFSLQGSTPSGAYTITSSSGISTGAWHHIAATVDSSKAMKLYIDGAQIASGTHNITAWAPTDGNKALVIGSKWTYSAGSYDTSTLDGKMDNVRVYTHTLSAEGIAEQARCPVGYWKFDETSGTSASDSSGNGFSGTLTNGPTWTSGYINNGISLDGSNDYVSVASNAALKYIGGELTLAAWVYIDTTETTGGYLISKPWNTSSQFNYQLYLGADTKISFTLQSGLTGAKTVTTPSPLSRGAWHHVAATVDSAKVMKIYVDGIQRVSDTHAIVAWTPGADSNLAMAIGSLYPYGTNTAFCFDGKMDNVRVYDRELGTNDIRTLAIDPPPLSSPPWVQSVVVNDGNVQRSMVTSVTVTFSGEVTIDPDAFAVLKMGAGGGWVTVAVVSTFQNQQTIAILTFSDSLTGYGSLIDGEYQLTVRSNAIRDSVTQVALDGDRDGLAGGNFVFGNRLADAFFRKFGDSDGDRDVDTLDLLRFRQAYLTPGSYKWYFDLDNDTDIDSLDLLRFRQRYLQ